MDIQDSQGRGTESKILISGGSGFVGRALSKKLQAAGYTPIVLSRDPKATGLTDMQCKPYSWLDPGLEVDAVINLAGAGIANKRWSRKRKQELRDGRLQTTTRLCNWVNSAEKPPRVFISASAIGYYGATGDTATDETAPAGDDFGARLCRDWEAAVELVPEVRRVILRLGIVLGRGGALAKMLPAFRLGLGGRLGDGQQWMSWIALDDLTTLFLQALVDPRYTGTINAVAPQTVRNAQFTQALAEQLKRPAFLPAPALGLKLILGEMASLLLDSQRVVPTQLEKLDFEYAYAKLKPALRQALV